MLNKYLPSFHKVALEHYQMRFANVSGLRNFEKSNIAIELLFYSYSVAQNKNMNSIF